MKIIKEKVIGTRGPWLFKARLVEYVTKVQGRFNRPEVVFEKMGDDITGFTLEDLEQIHAALQQFAQENLYMP
jgi:hypothetical protein